MSILRAVSTVWLDDTHEENSVYQVGWFRFRTELVTPKLHSLNLKMNCAFEAL